MAALLGVIAPSLRADAPEPSVPPINSPASSDYFTGKLVWANLYTADVDAATRFYTQLFGWTAQSAPGRAPRTILLLDGRPMAGIVTRSAQPGEAGHARWVSFASVPDVKAALAAAESGGAKALHPAHEVPGRGEQAVFEDSEGAILGLIHSSSGDPGEYLPEVGEWTWAELFARDTGAEARFYANVVGYEIVPDQRTSDPNRLVLVSGGYSRASILPLPDRPQAHPAWLPFVRVESVKDAVDRAQSLGARILVEPGTAASHYEQAIIADPTGGAVGLVELPVEGTSP